MTFQLFNLGWTPFFQSQLTLEEHTELTPARVAEVHRGHWLLWSEQGEIRLAPVHSADVTVGDWVLLDQQLQQLVRTLQRASKLQRVAAGTQQYQQLLAANVNTMFIVSGCDHDFNLQRIERYLSLAYQADIWPVLVLSKKDLNDEFPKLVKSVRQLKSDLTVEAVDTRNLQDIKALEQWCDAGQTVVMLGSSGVGKSTLANSLCQAEQLTATVRPGDSKGKHTTTARSMLWLNQGGLLIDTPGMRELQLAKCSTGINTVFADIEQLTQQCSFSNCRHQQEPGCAVNQAIEDGLLDQRRLQHYRKLLQEQVRQQQTIAERREQDRQTTKLHKRVQGSKYNRRSS